MPELHRATADDLTDPVLDSLTRMIGGLVSDGAALGWTDPPAWEELEDLLRGIVDGPAHDACGLRLLLEQAQTAGFEHLTLDLREGNERAQHLYTSEGFREYGRLADFVAPGDGTRCAKIFMVRSFA
ncbi:hypothetical protein AB0271_11470 [Kocuria palustris]|uniref:GNAT family N-acetyltransferase n=1 Tax=Kocuria palustris TaxID=71999 RepID=UPI00344EA3EB